PTLPAPVETLSAALETVPEPSPPKPIFLKAVETTPFLPCQRKKSLQSPPCSIANKVLKSEQTKDDVCLLLKTETIETTQMKPKVGDFVMLYPNHPP
ncbi:hypothetical protein NPIL_467961, partial [Nephila pilipes]